MIGIAADLTETETAIVTVATAIVIATHGVTDRAIRGAIGRATSSRNAVPAPSAARRLARTSRSARIRHPVKTNPRGATSRREEINRLDRIRPGAMKGSERGTSAETAGDEVGVGAGAAGATAANTLRMGAAPNPPRRLPATATAPTRRRRA
jgi:hypothetical protein